jgi:hypothetical protein
VTRRLRHLPGAHVLDPEGDTELLNQAEVRRRLGMGRTTFWRFRTHCALLADNAVEHPAPKRPRLLWPKHIVEEVIRQMRTGELEVKP